MPTNRNVLCEDGTLESRKRMEDAFRGIGFGHIIREAHKLHRGMRMTEEKLHRVRFFEFLTDEERSEFMEDAEPAAFEAGVEIISEGKEPSSLFVLMSGRVEVRKRLSGGRDRLLAKIDADREATVVGERGLLGTNEASATVRATSRVEGIRIPRETFRRMISDGRPAAFKLSYRIARTLAMRLTRLDEEIVEAIRDLERRGETDLEAFQDRLITEWTI